MLTPRVSLLLIAAVVAADAPTPLTVIRVVPGQDADPGSVITVTFDRPVAGSLDRTVDPKSVLILDPVLMGTFEWRDPVTLRFRPAQPLASGQRIKGTVRPNFTAMDGSSLAQPYTFEFRVKGPRVLAGLPAGPGQSARFLPPDAKFRIALSAPADPELLGRLVYLQMNRACPTPGTIALTPGPQTTIPEDAPWQFREAGGWDRDHSADPLRRLVTLSPARPLPYGCTGELITPKNIDAEDPGELAHWDVETYGAFALNSVYCRGPNYCPNGPIVLEFTTPVKGSEVLKHLTVLPKVDFTVADTQDVSERWVVDAPLKPRLGYLVRVDSTLKDAFGQTITGYPVKTAVTTGYRPDVSYVQGRQLVERVGKRTLGITYVNVDTLEVLTIPVPDSLEGKFLSRSEYGWGDDWKALAPKATKKLIRLGAARDRVSMYGYEMPAPDASVPGTPTLFLVRATSPRLRRPDTSDAELEPRQPIALVQVTDLGVHAKLGLEEGVVWVTGASDGKPRAGATVVLKDIAGKPIARAVTDSMGLARIRGIKRPKPKADEENEDWQARNFDGYLDVRLGGDRAVVGVNPYDADLSPWRFNVSSAWGDDRIPAAAAVFTERGIYRPGDSVYAKAIVRTGLLGALKAPARTDSVKLVFKDRDDGVLKETTLPPSAFGTLTQAVRLPRTAPLGYYIVTVSLKRQGEWTQLATANYRVAEYRPPEFLVDVVSDTVPRFDGDTMVATVGARYLFGAPMGRAKVTWSLRQTAYAPWSAYVPNTDGYYLGAQGWWWEEMQDNNRTTVSESRVDTLDATGHLQIRTPLKLVQQGRSTMATLEAVVTDVNRQTVYATASTMVHPAEFYLGAKPEGENYFWKAGIQQSIRVIAVTPTGQRLDGVKASGVLVRREWHQVRREQDGYSELVGEWVSDTTATCNVSTQGNNALCQFTPKLAGSYTVELRAKDRAGREVVTSFYRWATGPGWVPWSDESQFKMDVIPDKTRYTVGDTATILFAAPFTNAEAWVTVEREGLIEQRRLRITEGATTLKFPVTEAWAPNAFVSIVVARGRSAAPGPLDDPGRPTIRVGYAELRVTPEKKRLSIALKPDQTEYRPGQKARIGVEVREAGAQKGGPRSEVTLWAVDEGVLALTGYETPDPVDLIYQARGLGMRLASTLTSVAPQVPAGDKGRNPGGGGGDGAADVLRSRFRTTAFFLGSVVTDSAGNATATVTLPDNLTTFRVMAVAVTAGDRYGKGQTPMLVTRPLLARAALPRFIRPGDKLQAGVVVNHRLGGTPTVRVSAQVKGATLTGDAAKSVTLDAGRGKETRFDFTAVPGDSATFRFDVGGAKDSDAVQAKLPILPPTRASATVAAGMLRDTSTVEIVLPGGLDLAQSKLSLSLGGSPIGLLNSYKDFFHIYPYYCSEQVSSAMMPLLALYRARKAAGGGSGDTLALRKEILTGIEILVRRQRPAGGIGLWSAEDWTSPWLTAHAGNVLLEARAAGFAIGDSTVTRISEYLRESLKRSETITLSVSYIGSDIQARLTERLGVAEFLSRANRRDRALENDLVRQANLMSSESRIGLAVVMARGNDLATARRLLEPFWRVVTVSGRMADVPDSLVSGFYFRSEVRAPALLLEATLAVDPTQPLVAPLFESIITRGRARGPWWYWNTQDYAYATRAIGAWLRRFPPAPNTGIRARLAGAILSARDTIVPLTGLVVQRGDSAALRVSLENNNPATYAYYALTVTHIPKAVPSRPDYKGIIVERWYEGYESGKPIIEVAEGELVRVRLKVTVPEDRSFVVVDDALPAGLEAVDLSLNTVGLIGPGAADSASSNEGEDANNDERFYRWDFGSWDAGWWSPFDHRELRDDRVVYAARVLWKGTYTMTYVARATTPGVFVRPPAYAEEMYNPAVYGRTDGGVFTVKVKAP